MSFSRVLVTVRFVSSQVPQPQSTSQSLPARGSRFQVHNFEDMQAEDVQVPTIAPAVEAEEGITVAVSGLRWHCYCAQGTPHFM